MNEAIVIVDGENVFHSIIPEEIKDWQKFKERLFRLSQGESTKIIYYQSINIGNIKNAFMFFKRLENQGYKVKYKKLILKGKEPKSEIDPLIAADICRFAANGSISTIILVSGDHHFVDAVKLAKEKGKEVKVVSTASSLSEELKQVSDEWIDLNGIVSGITQKSEMETKIRKAIKNLNKGKKINLSTLEVEKE